MKFSSFIHFARFGMQTILFRNKEPILGTIIVTDKCNLQCKHCSVNNITGVIPVSYTHLDVYKRQKVVNENKLEIQFHSGIVLVQRMDFEE